MYNGKKQLFVEILFLLVVLTTFIITGCNMKTDSKVMFDDNSLDISIVKKQTLPHGFAYTIRLKNNGPYTVKNNSVFLSYPIKTGQNETRTNPFKVEAKESKGRIDYVKPGDEITLVITAPVKDVFTDTKRLDIEHPSLELSGYVLQGTKEISYMKGIGS